MLNFIDNKSNDMKSCHNFFYRTHLSLYFSSLEKQTWEFSKIISVELNWWSYRIIRGWKVFTQNILFCSSKMRFVTSSRENGKETARMFTFKMIKKISRRDRNKPSLKKSRDQNSEFLLFLPFAKFRRHWSVYFWMFSLVLSACKIGDTFITRLPNVYH